MQNAKNESVIEIDDCVITVRRVFNAPRELVFEAWTTPDHIVQWWGPAEFTTTTETMEVKPGGVWKHTMHGPDGVDYPNCMTYSEVVRPERIAYSNIGTSEELPTVTFSSVVTFEDVDGNTELTLTMTFPTKEALRQVIDIYQADEGAREMYVRLAEFLHEAQNTLR